MGDTLTHLPSLASVVSAYRKLRLSPDRISEVLRSHDLVVNVDSAANGMIRVVATKR